MAINKETISLGMPWEKITVTPGGESRGYPLIYPATLVT
jgi:hypothetical protein